MFGELFNGGHTAFFGSTEGAPTGCTRVQATGGNPGESSVAAANGDAGHMMVPIRQTGGVGYSMMPSSAGGLMSEQQRYSGDAMRSDLNPERAFPTVGGGRNHRRRRNGGTRRMRNLKRSISAVSRRGSRSLKRLGKFGFKGLRRTVGKTSNVARSITRPLTKKYRKSLSSIKRRNSRRVLRRSGLRKRFFAGNGKNNKRREPPTSIKRNMRGGMYAQYMNNTPFSMGYSAGNVQLSSRNSALASPAPMTPYVQ